MRRYGRRGFGRSFGSGALAWLWAHLLVLAALVLLIVLALAWYFRNQWAEFKETEKLRENDARSSSGS